MLPETTPGWIQNNLDYISIHLGAVVPDN